MTRLARFMACTTLAAALTMAADLPDAADEEHLSVQWVEGAAGKARDTRGRQCEASLRREYDGVAPPRTRDCPGGLYASTPNGPSKADVSRPALGDEDTRRRLNRTFLDGGGGGSTVAGVAGLPAASASGTAGVAVFAAKRKSTASFWSRATRSIAKDSSSHPVRASGRTTANYRSDSDSEGSYHVHLFPSASEALREGFVRVINHAAEGGAVMVDAVDDSGRAFDTITLPIAANETVHFNSVDLETGNPGKGLSGRTGSGQGDWRLAFSSDLDIEVLSYIRTDDGFLTAMHDVTPVDGDVHRVAIFNPGSNRNQVSRLRLVNPTDGTAEATIRGTDDKGPPGTGQVSLTLEPGAAAEITAQALESGGNGFEGMLGDGSGKWGAALQRVFACAAGTRWQNRDPCSGPPRMDRRRSRFGLP